MNIIKNKIKLTSNVFFILSAQLFVYVIFSIVGCYLNIDRPAFNVSYYILLIALFLFGNIITLILSLLLVFFDLLYSVSLGGLSGSAVLGLIKLVPESGMYGYSMLLLGVSFYGAIAYLIYKIFTSYNKSALGISLIIICLISVLSNRIFSYPLMTTGLPGFFIKEALGKEQDKFINERLFSINVNYEPIGGGSFLYRNTSKNTNKNISIVIESLGVSTNPDLVKYIENKFRENLGYRVGNFSVSESKGTTINGEIRELCSQNTDSLVISSIPRSINCLPDTYKKKGIYTAAYHNNNAEFYDRLLWYKDAGFSDFFDKKKLLSMGYKSSNYAFNGIADVDVAKSIVENVKNRKSYFVHWMTLDSHGPYSKSLFETDDSFDCKAHAVTNYLECNYYKSINNTIDTIISMAKYLPYSNIIISGDHEPHFQDTVNPLLIKDATRHFFPNKVISLNIKPENQGGV